MTTIQALGLDETFQMTTAVDGNGHNAEDPEVRTSL
jgi:hypothetical protein